MEALFSQIKTLAGSADEAGRRTLLDALVGLQNELEAPTDTLSRLYGLHLVPTVARIGVDLKIFELLADGDKPQDLEILAKKTGAAPILLGEDCSYIAMLDTAHTQRSHSSLHGIVGHGKGSRQRYVCTEQSDEVVRPARLRGRYPSHVSGAFFQAIPAAPNKLPVSIPAVPSTKPCQIFSSLSSTRTSMMPRTQPSKRLSTPNFLLSSGSPASQSVSGTSSR